MLILDLQPIRILGQRKAFYRQRIPEVSCMRRETFTFLVTSRNSDKKNHVTYQNNK